MNERGAVLPGSEALSHLAATLSFPRRSGSRGNERARALITEYIGHSGIDVKTEPFTYFPSRSKILTTSITISLIIFTYSIFFITWFGINDLELLHVVLPIGMPCLLFMQYSMPLRWRMRMTGADDGTRKQGALHGVNVYADIQRKVDVDEAPSLLVIGAHYDSISLHFPPILSLFVFISNTAGIMLLSVLDLFEGLVHAAGGATSPWFRACIAFLALLLCGTLIARMLNKRSNRSDGAVDNATGCAVLLSLVRSCMNLSRARYSTIRLVFFDAEEEGLWGSLFHAKVWVKDFQHRFGPNIRCISLDEVGGPGRFLVSTSFGFPRVTRSVQDNDIAALCTALAPTNTRKIFTWFPYPASDHAPFLANGMPAAWISHASINANSRRDTVAGIHGQHMKRVLDVVTEFLQKGEEKTQTVT